MQNSICNLNVFILRYAGAIFIFTENEGFTRQEEEEEQEKAKKKERVVQAAWQPKPDQARPGSAGQPMSVATAINFPILLSV